MDVDDGGERGGEAWDEEMRRSGPPYLRDPGGEDHWTQRLHHQSQDTIRYAIR